MGSLSLSFYDKLLQFHLFQGLSRAELLQMAGNTKFGFLKLAPRKPVVREGDLCQELRFLVSGRLQITTESDDHSYAVVEPVSAPWLLQPEALFGASPRYSASVVTLSEAHFITVSKDEVLRLLDDFFIFRLNLLNYLATQTQRRVRHAWRRAPRSLRERIIIFFLDHSVYPAGHKEFRILMTQLAQQLGCSRLDVSRALNALQREGFLLLRRGRIEVPSLERLLM